MSDQPPVPPSSPAGAPPPSLPPPSTSNEPTDPSRPKARRGGVAYSTPQPAATVRRSRISAVWIIPLVALCIAAYLGYRTVSEEGPLVTLTFRSADGLTAAQTQVRHKAVQLGVVETIRLSDDMSNVIVTLRMRREARPYLTDTARFWVVRPRISSGSLAGIETLVSGGYIEMDPGARAGPEKLQFTGLEQPPGVRYGEPGRTFVMRAERVGSLTAGAPVFWRDITVGEVLGYDIGNGTGPVTVNIFVRAPYDGFVHTNSHFWNASGLSVQVGAAGLHVEVASLQALLSGGVAFDTPAQAGKATQAAAETVFPLFHNYDEAQASGYTTTQAFVTYFQSSVRGLGKGSAVEFDGIQIGTVTAVTLQPDTATSGVRVRVDLEIQPERVLGPNNVAAEDPVTTARRLVAQGMKAQLQTASYLTGQQVLAMNIAPGALPGEIVQDGKDLVIPSQGGGIDNILTAVSDMAGKLDRLPLDQIGQNLNGTLRSASGALASVQELVRNANAGLTPLFRRVPEITASLQDAAAKASRTFGSLDTSYGTNSQFQRELERAMTQVGDTARSIRLLADFLDRHPEALVRGRAGVADR
jgi:paraquat-inducible protein B